MGETTRTIYVSGPMTGIADHNFPAFNQAAVQLRHAGFEVRNPAENGCGALSWADYIRRDLRDVLDVDGVALLPDWTRSRGARLEVHVARELGLPIAEVSVWLAGGQPLASARGVGEGPALLEQDAVHAWSIRNFGQLPQTVVTLGLTEEVGELCRAVLKRAQGIRGTREGWSAEVHKEIGDCVIKLMDIAAYEGVDLIEVVARRWADVSQRDWVTNPNGHGLPESRAV